MSNPLPDSLTQIQENLTNILYFTILCIILPGIRIQKEKLFNLTQKICYGPISKGQYFNTNLLYYIMWETEIEYEPTKNGSGQNIS